MPTDSEIVESFYDAASDGDIDRMKELTHRNCAVTEPESLPFGGTIIGKDAFVELLGKVDNAFHDYDFNMQFLEEGDDHVFVYFDFEATSEDGDRVETNTVEIMKVEEGQIIENDIFYKDPEKLISVTE